MRSMLRMLFPSARAPTTMICFSLGRMVAIRFYSGLVVLQKPGLVNNIIVAQKEITKKIRTGRPKLPIGSAKDTMVRVRVTQAEHKQMESAAKRAGMIFSDWLRKSLLDASQTDIL
ncbi:MAG: hypothetical protein ACFUZC_09870 [Chthoniobacteraceae bacterium]